jgi:hypothetical protein
MGWFKKKPSWEEQYAQNIYDGLVAHNEIGDITALKLRIPTALHHAYQNKIVLLACTRFRGHRVRCFDGAGGGSWRDGSLPASSSLRLCA